jgi:hypothetical protein
MIDAAQVVVVHGGEGLATADGFGQGCAAFGGRVWGSPRTLVWSLKVTGKNTELI